MPRTKGASSRQKRRKIFKLAAGMRGGRSRLYKTAKESVLRALAFSFRDRRARRREFRSLWVARLNAAARAAGLNYSQLIAGLSRAKVELNRKMLSELAVNDPAAMERLIELARSAPAR